MTTPRQYLRILQILERNADVFITRLHSLACPSIFPGQISLSFSRFHTAKQFQTFSADAFSFAFRLFFPFFFLVPWVICKSHQNAAGRARQCRRGSEPKKNRGICQIKVAAGGGGDCAKSPDKESSLCRFNGKLAVGISHHPTWLPHTHTDRHRWLIMLRQCWQCCCKYVYLRICEIRATHCNFHSVLFFVWKLPDFPAQQRQAELSKPL